MRSDFLDTSNLNRLRAFFLFTDAANLTGRNVKEFGVGHLPLVQHLVGGVIEYQRQRAVQAALDLFDPFQRTPS